MAVGTIAALTLSMVLHAQDFKLGTRTVQVHGFASQGFAYTNQNNFLTMNTSHGSPALTEGALNLSMPVTEKFRVGGQGYTRKIGSLDDFRPQLDWAYGDYRFAPWFGVRAGKVKTALGLYNDTQDMDFLHTWALLPQGIYPADLRSTYIAHIGGDLYGRIPLKKFGKLDYTAYAGTRSFDNRGGYYYYSEDSGFNIKTIDGHTEGWDLRWTTPVKGLMLGSSWENNTMHRAGAWTSGIYKGNNYTIDANPERLSVGYGDYSRGKWEFSSEYRNTNQFTDVRQLVGTVPGAPMHRSKCLEAWFATAAYRVTPKLQVGYYHSNLHIDNPKTPTNLDSNHIRDEVVTGRYDIDRFWTLKAEGHFMNGYGDVYTAQGFYLRYNTAGLKPTTNLLVLKASFNF
jgi:hypothetical protein